VEVLGSTIKTQCIGRLPARNMINFSRFGSLVYDLLKHQQTSLSTSSGVLVMLSTSTDVHRHCLTPPEIRLVLQAHNAILQLQKSKVFKQFFMHVVALDTAALVCEYNTMPSIYKSVLSLVRHMAISSPFLVTAPIRKCCICAEQTMPERTTDCMSYVGAPTGGRTVLCRVSGQHPCPWNVLV
jgi:hypothetical protein